MKNEVIENTLETFRKEVVMTIEMFEDLLNVSTITIRRYLKKWKVHTSYNKNGRYYVLPNVPNFNNDGQWKYQDIRFSKYGSLKKTIIVFVQKSFEGLDALKISKLLGFDSYSLLARLVDSSDLIREKFNGRYIYFSTDSTGEKQINKRQLMERKPDELLYNTNAILVLVEKIKFPNLQLPQLIEKLYKQGVSIDYDMVYNLFTKYGLLKKTLNLN